MFVKMSFVVEAVCQRTECRSNGLQVRGEHFANQPTNEALLCSLQRVVPFAACYNKQTAAAGAQKAAVCVH